MFGVYGYFAHISIYDWLVPGASGCRRVHQVPWNWGHKPLWAPWVLSSKSGSSGRAHALIHCAPFLSPTQTIFSLLERAEKWAAIHAVDSGALSQSHDDYTLSCPFSESWCLQSLLDRCTLVKKMGKERSLLEASHLILMQFDLSTTELCSQEKLQWKEQMLIMLGEHRNI